MLFRIPNYEITNWVLDTKIQRKELLHTFNRNAVPTLVNTQTRPKPNTKGQSRILIFTHRRFIRNLDKNSIIIENECASLKIQIEV